MTDTFTIADMSKLSDTLREAMSNIMDKKNNTLKYRHWRVRLMWKNIFNLHTQFDNAYTKNIYYIFKTAISYHIEEMGEEETIKFIDTILKTMKEV